MCSVLIVEPSEIIFEGLRAVLTESDEYNVLSPMKDISMLEERLPALCPEVLVVNPTVMELISRSTHHGSVRGVMASLARMRPSMPILALVYQYIEPSVVDVFDGVIDIRMSRSMVRQTVASAIKSKDAVVPLDNEKEDSYELSTRETDVLVLVAKGMSSKEIADALNISIHTVNSHRKNITHKTGIKSVAGLAVYAMLHNLMED